MSKLDFSEKDLRSLRIFCTVAQAGGFAAAEHQLNMSKSSISRHVREVEEHLGVRLCERGPAGFELTAAGRIALEVAGTALRSLEQIKPEIDAVSGRLSGTLSIGMVEHVMADTHFKLPEALSELKRIAPSVRPEISVMTFANLNQALRERKVQIAIRGMYKKDRTFDYLTLFVEKHQVYKRKDAKESSLPLVYRPHPFVEQLLTDHGFVRGPDAGGLEAIAVLVSTGSYYGLLPSFYAEQISRRYKINPLGKSPVFHNTICAITEASRPLSQGTKLFLSILSQQHQATSE